MVFPESWKCPNCHKMVKNNKVCTNCKFKFSKHYPDLWQCPNCDNLIHDSRFCDKCDYPNNLHYPHLWHCNKCGKLVRSKTKCDNCGFDKSGLNKESNKSVALHKKISPYAELLLRRKNVLLLIIGLVTILGVFLLFSFPALPSNSFSTSDTVYAGVSFSPLFSTSSSAQSVSFDFTSPSGKTYSYTGTLNDNVWSIPGLVLNESGKWNVVIKITSFGVITEVFDSVNVSSSCSSSNDCSNGLCCNGACVNVCNSNSDCDDYNSNTIDVCVSSGSCNAKCVYREPECFSSVSDNYCPSNCNIHNDIDCTNCASGEVECNGVCYETCYSDSDCDDGDDSTFDDCVLSVNPCNSYCNNLVYSSLECPSGQLRLGTECVSPACSSNNDCFDGRSNYAHKCVNPGTVNAYCLHDYCESYEIACDGNCVTPACSSNNDCTDSSSNTFGYCMNHDTCDAYCLNTCANGFSNYAGECLKSCNSISDCAAYFGDYNTDCNDECSGDEDCLVNCYVDSESIDYLCTNNVCRVYECNSDSNCDDEIDCTRDYCMDNVCHNEFISNGPSPTNSNVFCCNSEPVFDCGGELGCNTPNLSYDFVERINTDFSIINNVNVTHTQESWKVIVEDEGRGSGLSLNSINCETGKEYWISVDVLVENGEVIMYYEGDANDYSVTISSNNWNTYSIGGNMYCGSNDKLMIVTNSDDSSVFYIDNIKVYYDSSNPGNCVNSGSCNSECVEVNECIDSDGFCPVGCTGIDNDCVPGLSCPSGLILCDGSCITPTCSIDSDCSNWWESCDGSGTCEAVCSSELASISLTMDSDINNNGLDDNLEDYSYCCEGKICFGLAGGLADYSIVSGNQRISTSYHATGTYVNIDDYCINGKKIRISYDLTVSSGSVLVAYENHEYNTYSAGTYSEVIETVMECTSNNENLVFFANYASGANCDNPSSVNTVFSINDIKIWFEE